MVYESEIPSSACDQTLYCGFYCHDIGLVIELDGSQHGTNDAIEYDAERTQFLEALGLTVVRYWNHDVLGRTDVVLEDLWHKYIELKNTSPNPLLKGEGISLSIEQQRNL